ncbi:unnamed protein product [Prorocentrum cordatum]|uniref:Uncharacterized protein n=1 Tax=Prorocentrum cordatum TaxID=2364126 RepID=A0ABN9SH17_9DINO|nr:unnamed protein product [Polarella glacialis]
MEQWTMGASTEKDARLWFHVSPHETASTTIQEQRKARHTFLTSDGWTLEDPAHFGHVSGHITQISNFAECHVSYPPKPFNYVEKHMCLEWLQFIDHLKGTS